MSRGSALPRRAARMGLVPGLLLLGALWLGPLPEMARTSFSAHMLLHLGIVSVAAPLLSFGLIGFGLVRRLMPLAALSAFLALAIDVVVVWGWHAPALHEAAARHEGVFVVQQLSFLAAGLAVWTTAFRDDDRGSLLMGVAAMFLTFSHMAMLGILLALAPELLYAPDLCLGAFGFTQLEDQQLGGVLMASVGGIPHLIGGVTLMYLLLAAPDGPDRESAAGDAA